MTRLLFSVSLAALVGLVPHGDLLSSEKPRHVDLFATDDPSVVGTGAEDAQGRVSIVDTFGPGDHPGFPDYGPNFKYHVQRLPQLDWGDFIANSDGRFIYSVYMWTPTTGRLRIQNFNTPQIGESFASGRYLFGLDESALALDPLCVEIWFERDDGIDGPDNPFPGASFPVLRGETAAGVCAQLQ